MSRSLFKGPFFNEKKKKNCKNKNLAIMPRDINKLIFVYNGKKFTKVKITDEKVGYKLGEFINTRVLHKYKKK